jgi:multiple sugar transport system substrate-binding protein
MKADKLIPLAFGDKDGWPAMGTFDILNMRMNGYDFHIGLMAGKQKWTDAKVKAVFQKWAELLPYFDPQPLGKTWQEAAQDMIGGKAGMYFLGTFAGEQATDKTVHDDLDFFPFPSFGTAYDAENAIDAPIDGFMVSAKAKNVDQAKAFMEFLATPAAQLVFLASSPNNVAAAKDADTSTYSPFQKKMAEIIGGAGKIAQFLDRDTNPAFAGANGMQGFLQKFLGNPTQDLDAFLKGIQDFYDTLS